MAVLERIEAQMGINTVAICFSEVKLGSKATSLFDVQRRTFDVRRSFCKKTHVPNDSTNNVKQVGGL